MSGEERNDRLVEAMSGAALEPASVTSEGLEGIEAELVSQQADAEKYTIVFLSKVIRLRGVKIDREQFLSQELRKLGLSDAQIEQAIASTPVQACVGLIDLDVLARKSIDFETRKSAGMSFATGLPGGFAMLATVPADVTQYYVHAFRISQKLAFLYGWRDLLDDLDEVDDETVGKFAVFLGVMMGVAGASASLGSFAQQVARPALQKQITKQALAKNAWYPVMKRTLALIGVKVTKDSFAKTVTKAVPLVGGVISGGMTLVALKSQARRLHEHLRELPPPGVDAADYGAALAAADVEAPSPVRVTAQNAVEGAQSAAAAAAGRATGAARSLLQRGRERLG
ncbi:MULTISPECIES: hypothetical protein [Actinomyces]|nr:MULTISPECIES: hypothetical protein [Actinomyces]